MPSAAAQDRGKDYYYAVLGVSSHASEAEIHERYRALSLIFHPDKQHYDTGDGARQTAQNRHLEAQKAYQVLSDPFLRTVYDTLGEAATSIKWGNHLRRMPKDELRTALMDINREHSLVLRESAVRPSGEVIVAYDASAIFSAEDHEEGEEPSSSTLLSRVQHIQQTHFNIQHSITTSLNSKTSLTLGANAGQLLLPGRGHVNLQSGVMGTVRHQLTSGLVFQASIPLLTNPMRSVTTLKTTYNSSGSRIFLETFFSPIFLTQGVVPPATLHYGRVLWPSSGTEGNAIASIGPAGPSVTIQVTRPHKFDLLSSASPRPSPVDGSEEEDTRPHLPQQGLAAFTRGSGFSQYGLTLAGLDSQLNAEWGVNFEELSLELRTGAHLRTTGHIEWEATGIWKWPAELDDSMHGVMIPGRHDTSISAGVVLEFGGVHLVFEAYYLGQKFKLPIKVLGYSDDRVAFCFALVPATLTAVYYSFVARPRQRTRRKRIIHQARAQFNDPAYEPSREAANTRSLLADTAVRHMRAEAACEGLIIQQASYAPYDNGKEIKGLVLDVTIPLQALVRRSQLAIPGTRSKSQIPGFFDPLPHAEKTLVIQYTFGGRPHFATLPDNVPVVLPLADHAV